MGLFAGQCLLIGPSIWISKTRMRGAIPSWFASKKPPMTKNVRRIVRLLIPVAEVYTLLMTVKSCQLTPRLGILFWNEISEKRVTLAKCF